MTIFGKRLSEYVSFVLPFLILIAVVGILRLALSLAGLPNSTTTFLSMTVAVWLGGIVTAIRIHKTGFGSPDCRTRLSENLDTPASTRRSRAGVAGPIG